MPTSSDDRNPVERLAEEFADRYRRGERPPLSEYVARYPEHADEIRELFPALVMMEQLKPVSADLTGAYDGDATEATARRPERLGDYRILREVGRGGMGVVYEAEQISLGRRVALKVLPSQALLSPTHLERFRREARAAAKLHHTNIVPVYGVGEADGVHFYAMQFIRGEGLDRVLNDLRRLRHEPAALSQGSVAAGLHTGQLTAPAAAGPATPDATERPAEPVPAASSTSLSGGPAHAEFHRGAARIALQVAEALAYAHKQGVLHRDVKPSNLLLDTQGAVWVTDFGLAKAEGADELTHTGDVVGTVRFMAPERFEGRSLPQSDVYALGLTLYEVLTLRPAFDDVNRAKLIERVLHESPVPPRTIDAHVPRDLETVVLKCLAKDPHERYSTAEALAEDLRRFLADRPIKARRAGNAERFWRWCRRNPSVATLSAVALALLIAVAAVASISAVSLKGERDRVIGAHEELSAQYRVTEEERRRADGEWKRAEQAERATKARLWEAKLSEARALRMSRQPGQRFGSLLAIREAMNLPLPEARSLNELRTEAIAALCLPDFEVAREWDGAPAGYTGFALDADFRRYARADSDGNVSVRRVEDDEELAALPGVGPSTEYDGLQFSPDGRFLHVVAGGAQVRGRLWKLDGPRPALVRDDDHTGFAFSPDGKRCAAGHPDGTVLLLDSETGKALRRYVGGIAGDTRLLWRPNSDEVLIQARHSWRLLDLATGRPGPVMEVKDRISWAAWHPEGRLMAFGSDADYKITFWDAQTRQPARPPMEGPKQAGVIMCFNRAGDRLLSSDWSGLWRLWDARTGQLLLTLPTLGTQLQFSLDDGLVGANVASPKAQTYRFAAGSEFSTLARWAGDRPGRYDPYLRAALHPNGRLLAVSAYPEGVVLIDLARLEEVALLPVPGSSPLLFEPGGDALLTYGPRGLLRWPVRAGEAAGSFVVSPPTRLTATTHLDRWGCSADGRTVAIPEYSLGATVWRPADNRSVRLGPQHDVRSCAVSPDGRWVVTGSHSIKDRIGARVWDAATGKHVADLPTEGGTGAWFSPDGKRLVTNGGGYRAWEVGTWKEGPPLGPLGLAHGCAFTADGKLLALSAGPGTVRLVDPATGHEAARLTAPEESRLWPHGFTPDGGKLICSGIETHALHVFDLRAIRAGLREVGLDWSDDPLPPAAAKAEPLRVTVEAGPWRDRVEAKRLDDLARGHVGKNEFAEALALLRLAVRVDPDFALAHNDLAWLLLVGPDKLRDPKEALRVAERAVMLAPEERYYVNTLGVARYRNEQYEEAVRTLEKSLAKSRGDHDGFDLFVLAACHARLGDVPKAKDCFDRAVKWTQTREGLSPQHAAELNAFRAEAEEALKTPSR
jgi:serine/threonine protein kinase/WD40 repeat protein/Flp pilus assembly protein TadD